ncbi:hypothetical protein G6F59_019023 [Rhizopus arrhizus]|nr:hypothetical protein G6F59_019023 [Rhizopus arrhizus]
MTPVAKADASAGVSTMLPRPTLTRKPSAPSACNAAALIEWWVDAPPGAAQTSTSLHSASASRLSKYW